MKRTKLIASFLTICLAVCTLTYGIYAATNLSFTIGANIAFEVKNIFVDLELDITGGYYKIGDTLYEVDFPVLTYTHSGDSLTTNEILQDNEARWEALPVTSLKIDGVIQDVTEPTVGTVLDNLLFNGSAITPLRVSVTAKNFTSTKNIKLEVYEIVEEEGMWGRGSVLDTYTTSANQIGTAYNYVELDATDYEAPAEDVNGDGVTDYKDNEDYIADMGLTIANAYIEYTTNDLSSPFNADINWKIEISEYELEEENYILSTLSVPVYDEENDEITYVDEPALTSYIGESDTIFVPRSVQYIGGIDVDAGEPVSVAYAANVSNINIGTATSIAPYAFFGDSELTEVNLANNRRLTTIGIGAFALCVNLQTVNLSRCSRLVQIGSIGEEQFGAFQDCLKLTTANLSNCTRLTTLGDYIFSGCTSLNSLSLTSDRALTDIGVGAFTYCNSMTTFNFSNCNADLKISYFFDEENDDYNSLASDNASAFRSCENIRSISLPSNATYYSVSNNALYSKDYSLLLKYFPNSTATSFTVNANTIGVNYDAFEGIKNLNTINFTNSTALTSLYLSLYSDASLKNVNASNLTSLEQFQIEYYHDGPFNLGDGIQNYSSSVLEMTNINLNGCTGLTIFGLTNIKTGLQMANCTNFSIDNDGGVLRIYDTNSISLIYVIPNIAGDSYTVTPQITSMDYNAFTGLINIKDITIDSSSSYMPSFINCANLENIYVGQNASRLISENGILYQNDGGRNTLLCMPPKNSNITSEMSIYCLGMFDGAIYSNDSLEILHICPPEIDLTNTQCRIGKLINCPNITTIDIQDGFFSHYIAIFNAKGCPELDTINFGEVNESASSVYSTDEYGGIIRTNSDNGETYLIGFLPGSETTSYTPETDYLHDSCEFVDCNNLITLDLFNYSDAYYSIASCSNLQTLKTGYNSNPGMINLNNLRNYILLIA